MREFLGSGEAGSAYLIQDKLHNILVHASKKYDLVPLISSKVITGWEGGDLDVSIVVDDSYQPHIFTGGGEAPQETVKTVQGVISPYLFGLNCNVTGEMVDDCQWDLVEWHMEQAGKRMGEYATDLALEVLKSPPDGDGTANSGTSATTDTTTYAEVIEAIDGLGRDEFIANTMVITPEAWTHNVTLGYAVTSAHYWRPNINAPVVTPPADGFPAKVNILDTLFSTSTQLHDAADLAEAAFTTCITVIFDRFNALLTGRKRWLEIKNYSDPIRDLAGAVITSRQDSVTLYKDAVYTLTEST